MPTPAPALAAALLAVLAAAPAGAQLLDPYPLDGVLRVNDIQAKGTHNSYHLISPFWGGNVHPDFDYEHAPLDVQLAEQGVRKFELDLFLDPDGPFRVYHVNTIDAESSCPFLIECLSIIRDWSLANPWHHPIFVFLEPKGIHSPSFNETPFIGHYDRLDAEIRAVLEPDGLLVTPDEVRGSHATLREAILTDGWPTLRQTRGRVFVVMLDGGEDRDPYQEGHPSLAGRAMFVTSDEGRDDAAVIKVDGPTGGGFARIQNLVALGYVIRTRSDTLDDARAGDTTRREAAIASGAHLISTDYPVPGMLDSGYFLALPGGRPSRGNPIPTAGIPGSAYDIESPAWLALPDYERDEPRWALARGSNEGEPGFDETVDYDGDGRITIFDLNALRLATTPAPACGLFGIELALVIPLALWQRRRRRD